MSRFLTRIRILRTHYWFIPSLMAGAAVVLSFLVVAVDEAVKGKVEPVWWLYSGEQTVARRVLSAIAASMIAIITLAFSTTMTALTFVSTRYGSRVLRTFTHDPKSQIVLGAFISTFLYALLVLRTVHNAPDDDSLPRIAVTVAIVMALGCLGALIYFLYHLSEFVQAPNIIAAVSRDLDRTIDHLPKDMRASRPVPDGGNAAAFPDGFASHARSLPSRRTGYVQEIDDDTLMALCRRHDLLMRIEQRPGDFIVQGQVLALLWPADPGDPAIERRILDAIAIGQRRTIAQDVEFSVNQLVQVALQALSPGHNDTFTAMLCIDRLGAAFCRIAERSPQTAARYDGDGRLRLMIRPTTFADLVESAFGQIRAFGRTSTAVTVRLLQALTIIIPHIRQEEDRVVLLRQAAIIHRSSRGGLPEESDRQTVDAWFDTATHLLRDYKIPGPSLSLSPKMGER